MVLTKPLPISSKDAGAVLGSDVITDDKNIDRISFKGRVLGKESMHLPLPDPCMLSFGVEHTSVAKLIMKHTTFISAAGYVGKQPSVGDVVRVVLTPGDYSYNVQYAGFTKITVFGDGTRQHKRYSVDCTVLRTKFNRFTTKDYKDSGAHVDPLIVRVGKTGPCHGACPDNMKWQTKGPIAAAGMSTTEPLTTIKINSRAGPRMHPIDKVCKCHNGTDYGCSDKDDVYAIADGVLTVHKSGCVAGDMSCGGGFGNNVSILHTTKTSSGETIRSRYAHLTSITHPAGPIKKGAVIGKCGTTGKSTGNHLHLEIRTGDGNFWEPDGFIKKYI